MIRLIALAAIAAIALIIAASVIRPPPDRAIRPTDRDNPHMWPDSYRQDPR